MLVVLVLCDKISRYNPYSSHTSSSPQRNNDGNTTTSIPHHPSRPFWMSRKMAHLATVIGQCTFQNYFDPSHWTWRFNVLVPILFGCLLLREGFRYRNHDGTTTTTSFRNHTIGKSRNHHLHMFRTLTRTGGQNSMELCQGPLMMALVLIYTGLVHFQSAGTTYILGAVGFGDGLAPFVGISWPYRPYNCIPTRIIGKKKNSSSSTTKTVSGSCTVFFGTMLGIWILRSIVGAPQVVEPKTMVEIAGLATLAEAISGPWDNLMIAASIELYLRVCHCKKDNDRQ